MEASMNRLRKYGSDYVKKLKSYNATLLRQEGVVHQLEFAGRDIGSLRLFLDDIRDEIALPTRMVTEIGYPYIDRAFLKSYIKTVQALRKTKKELPKPTQIAKKLMADYFTARKKAIARQKKCSVAEVSDRDVFYPTSAEAEKNKVNYLQVGNPNYALSYILSNMMSREIELIKKTDSKDNLAPLSEENVYKEIQSAFSKYHDKYVLFDGKILRCNLKQKGVYFGDDFYLKEGKIVPIDTTKKIIVDGLIIDIETNDIENPIGIPEGNVAIIRDKIKNKKVTIKTNGKVKEIYANGEKILALKKKSGNRSYVTYINFPTITKLPPNGLGSISYLEEARFENLKEVEAGNFRFGLKKLYMPQVEKIDPSNVLDLMSKDVIINRELLEKNGIIQVGCYLFDMNSNRLIKSAYASDYFGIDDELKNKKVTVKIEGNVTIIQADGVDILTFKDDKLVKINLPSATKLSSKISYFADLEEISAPLVEEIKNSLMNCPKLKKINMPNLKKMENSIHQLPSLEEIDFPNLQEVDNSSMRGIKGVKRVSLPQFDPIKKGAEYQFSLLPSCTQFDVPALAKMNLVLFAGLLIDQEAGKCVSKTYMDFSKMINAELKGSKVSVQPCEGGHLLCADGKPVLKEENGQLTGIYLNKTEELEGQDILTKNPNLKEFCAPRLKKVTGYFDSFLEECPNLEKIECPELEMVEGHCFCKLESIKKLSLPKLKKLSYLSLLRMPNLVELNVAELENVPLGFLDETPKLEVLNAPLLNNRLKVLRRHPNKRKLLRKMQQKKDFMMHLKYASTLAK